MSVGLVGLPAGSSATTVNNGFLDQSSASPSSSLTKLWKFCGAHAARDVVVSLCSCAASVCVRALTVRSMCLVLRDWIVADRYWQDAWVSTLASQVSEFSELHTRILAPPLTPPLAPPLAPPRPLHTLELAPNCAAAWADTAPVESRTNIFLTCACCRL